MKPSDFLTELSNDKLTQYKTAAAADASKADKEGDFKKGDKRFSGIVKATKKQFDNDAKKDVAEGLSEPTRKVFFKVIKTQGTGMPSGYRRVKTMRPLEDGGFYIELSTPGYGMDYTRHNYKNFSLKDDQGKPITGHEANNIINGEQGVAEGSSMFAWNAGTSEEDFIRQFGKPEFDRLTKKYGISSIPVPDLYGYIAKEPTDPVVRRHRGLDGPGAKLKSIIKNQGVAENVAGDVNSKKRYHFLYPHVPLDMHTDHEYNDLSDRDLQAVKSHQRELAYKLGKPGAEEQSDIASHIQINRARSQYDQEQAHRRKVLDAEKIKRQARDAKRKQGVAEGWQEESQELDEAVDFSKYPIKVYQNKQTGKFIAWVDIKNGDKIFPNISADTKEEAEEKQKEQIENVLDNRTAGAKTVNAFKAYANGPFGKGILSKRDNEPTYIKIENNILYISTKPLPGFKPCSATDRHEVWIILTRKELDNGKLEPGTRYRPTEISTNNPDVRAFKLSEYNKILHSGDKSSDSDGPLFVIQYSGRSKTAEDVSEAQHSESCPHCGGEMVSEELMNEKKDACYYKVKSRYKVWPSAYASGALVKCRKKGADSWGNGSKNESSILEGIEQADESLHDWFNKEKWVRMDTKGNIKGPCAKEPGEGKPKCLPQAKAHSLGKKGRASAAARKRREDPNPERSGKAINVNTKKD